MAAAFDNLQSSLFATVTSTMGYDATWQPAAGAPQTNKVLYNGPTEKEKLFSANYDPDKLTMEYTEGMFPGLKESVDSGNLESVSIVLNGISVSLKVRHVQRQFDGKQYKATLVKP